MEGKEESDDLDKDSIEYSCWGNHPTNIKMITSGDKAVMRWENCTLHYGINYTSTSQVISRI